MRSGDCHGRTMELCSGPTQPTLLWVSLPFLTRMDQQRRHDIEERRRRRRRMQMQMQMDQVPTCFSRNEQEWSMINTILSIRCMTLVESFDRIVIRFGFGLIGVGHSLDSWFVLSQLQVAISQLSSATCANQSNDKALTLRETRRGETRSNEKSDNQYVYNSVTPKWLCRCDCILMFSPCRTAVFSFDCAPKFLCHNSTSQ